jgi:uncharacterized protein (TIGR00251 family)
MPERLSVYISPKSPRDEIAGIRQGELHLRVTVPPEGGKANAAACRLVAKALGVPKSSVRVARGESSRHKQIEVSGVARSLVEELLHDAGGR